MHSMNALNILLELFQSQFSLPNLLNFYYLKLKSQQIRLHLLLCQIWHMLYTVPNLCTVPNLAHFIAYAKFDTAFSIALEHVFFTLC
jgi:hypothetical protein